MVNPTDPEGNPSQQLTTENTPSNGGIEISDFDRATIDRVYNYLVNNITVIPMDNPMVYEIDESGDFGIACLRTKVTETESGTFLLEDSEITIYEEAFKSVPEEHRKEFMLLTASHEVIESLVSILLIQDNEGRKDARGIGHKMGLLEEYTRAKDKGIAYKYLSLVSRWARALALEDPDFALEFWEENLKTYEHVMSDPDTNGGQVADGKTKLTTWFDVLQL